MINEEDITMSDEMFVRAQCSGESSFVVSTGSGHDIVLSDAPEDRGACPMEMLLVALAGCAGIGVRSLLHKMQQNVTDYQIHVHGEKSLEDPKVFTSIVVEHVFTGLNLDVESIRRAIELDTTLYCGVNVMLDQSAVIRHYFQVVEQE
jgi:putative redox protein